MDYSEALERIASLEPRGWRLGLDRMQELVRRAGLEDFVAGHGRPKYIHVAGTNGKGSVTAMVQAMLVEAGKPTGAYFSPFVFDPRERIQFGREMVSEDEFAALATELWPIGESLSETAFGGVTEFELKTLMGFLYWKQKDAKWVALEVGLGGRLDATNVVMPAACVIVSIGLDHTSVLGDTEECIATEKAGIIKKGRPVAVGEMGGRALEVIEAAAEEASAPCWRYGREIQVSDEGGGLFSVMTPVSMYTGLRPSMLGTVQVHNMALAVAALDLAGANAPEGALRAGALRAALPGRVQQTEVEGVRFVLDGAHNADAARSLRGTLAGLLPGGSRVVLLTGMVQGHDPEAFYRELAPIAAAAHAAPIAFHRSLAAHQVAEASTAAGITSTAHRGLIEALKAAVSDAGPTGCVIVTGSFYLVGEAGRALGLTS